MLLAQTLIAELDPEWPDKNLDGARRIEEHRDRMTTAVAAVLEEYRDEAERRSRRLTDPDRADPAPRPMVTVSWTELPLDVLPEAASETAEAIRDRLDAETERRLAWARTDPATGATVTVVKVRSQFIAVIDEGGRHRYSPAVAERGAAMTAGIAAVESLTYQRWNRADPMWVESGGETDLLNVVPAAAVAPGAYRAP